MSADEEEGEIKGVVCGSRALWGRHLVSGLVRVDWDILSSDEKGRIDDTPFVEVSHLGGRMVSGETSGSATKANQPHLPTRLPLSVYPSTIDRIRFMHYCFVLHAVQVHAVNAGKARCTLTSLSSHVQLPLTCLLFRSMLSMLARRDAPTSLPGPPSVGRPGELVSFDRLMSNHALRVSSLGYVLRKGQG